jgi:hypothetical protein
VATVSSTPNVPGSGFRGIPFPQQATKGIDSSRRKPLCRPSSPSVDGLAKLRPCGDKHQNRPVITTTQRPTPEGQRLDRHRPSPIILPLGLELPQQTDKLEGWIPARPTGRGRWATTTPCTAGGGAPAKSTLRTSSASPPRDARVLFGRWTTGRPGNYGSPASHPSTQLPLCTMAHGHQDTAPHPRSNHALAQHTLAWDAWSVKGSSKTRRQSAARC